MTDVTTTTTAAVAAAVTMHCSDVQCCCGRDDCAYRQHTTAALEGLEKDVDAAARVGQVCSTFLIATPRDIYLLLESC